MNKLNKEEVIRFESDVKNGEIAIYLDSQGIDELIDYLNDIRRDKDHMHLMMGNELDSVLSSNKQTLISLVTLIYVEEEG